MELAAAAASDWAAYGERKRPGSAMGANGPEAAAAVICSGSGKNRLAWGRAAKDVRAA